MKMRYHFSNCFRSIRSCIPPTSIKKEKYREVKQLHKFLDDHPELNALFERRKQYILQKLDPLGESRTLSSFEKFGNSIFAFLTRTWDCGKDNDLTFDEANRISIEQYCIPLTRDGTLPAHMFRTT